MLRLALALSMAPLLLPPGGAAPLTGPRDRTGRPARGSRLALAERIVYLRLDRTTRSRLEAASGGLPLSRALRGLTIHVESTGSGGGALRLVLFGARYRRGRLAWKDTSEPFEAGPGPTSVPFDRLAPVIRPLEVDPVIRAPDFIIDGILVRRPDLLPQASWLREQAGRDAEDVLYLVAVAAEAADREVGSHPLLVRLPARSPSGSRLENTSEAPPDAHRTEEPS